MILHAVSWFFSRFRDGRFFPGRYVGCMLFSEVEGTWLVKFEGSIPLAEQGIWCLLFLNYWVGSNFGTSGYTRACGYPKRAYSGLEISVLSIELGSLV